MPSIRHRVLRRRILQRLPMKFFCVNAKYEQDGLVDRVDNTATKLKPLSLCFTLPLVWKLRARSGEVKLKIVQSRWHDCAFGLRSKSAQLCNRMRKPRAHCGSAGDAINASAYRSNIATSPLCSPRRSM